MPTHEQHMRHALGLAARATGCTTPNPLVGSIVVRDGVVVGEGWHRAAGQAHAEAEALAAAGDAARGATLYATLEPCRHHGRTPPCVDAILAAGIRHVVYALDDPNPAAAGGAEALRRAGVEVTQGVEEEAARALNRFFLHHVETARPYVIAKSACSLDGRVATRTGESRWITGPASRRRGHELRQAVDAIVVGADTVIADDPSLTVRLDAAALAPEQVRHPRAIVLDSRGRVPLDRRLLAAPRATRTLVATTPAMPETHRRELERLGCEVLRLDPVAGTSRVPLRALVDVLGARQVQSLLVEGGPEVLGGFLDANLVDELWSFVAPLVVGGAGARPAVGGEGIDRLAEAARIERPQVECLGPDVLIRGELRRVSTAPEAGTSTITADTTTRGHREKI